MSRRTPRRSRSPSSSRLMVIITVKMATSRPSASVCAAPTSGVSSPSRRSGRLLMPRRMASAVPARSRSSPMTGSCSIWPTTRSVSRLRSRPWSMAGGTRRARPAAARARKPDHHHGDGRGPEATDAALHPHHQRVEGEGQQRSHRQHGDGPGRPPDQGGDGEQADEGGHDPDDGAPVEVDVPRAAGRLSDDSSPSAPATGRYCTDMVAPIPREPTHAGSGCESRPAPRSTASPSSAPPWPCWRSSPPPSG